MSQDSVGAYPIRSVDRVCDVLDTLANSSDGVSLTEVATATGLPKSSAFRYLSALENRHYVERDDDAVTYRLGPAFRPQHRRGIERLIEIARPHLSSLRDRLGETLNVGILDGVQVIHALVIESNQTMRLAARTGDRGFVHCTALGKAMCADLPADRVLAILDAAGMERFTDTTITSPDGYFAELDVVRENGFAVDDQENQIDGRCVAVAIKGSPFPAGISLSAPEFRFPMAEVPTVAKELSKAAKKIAREFRG